jgi:holliday junction DNA helicase RuvB
MRIAKRLLRRVRDFAAVAGEPHIDAERARRALDELGIDPGGLERRDRAILRTLVETFAGGPVGLDTLATALGEDRATLEEVHEPFLIQRGLLQRTARGRLATERAYRHLGLSVPAAAGLFDDGG